MEIKPLKYTTDRFKINDLTLNVLFPIQSCIHCSICGGKPFSVLIQKIIELIRIEDNICFAKKNKTKLREK